MNSFARLASPAIAPQRPHSARVERSTRRRIESGANPRPGAMSALPAFGGIGVTAPLLMSRPGDAQEQEADRVAAAVVGDGGPVTAAMAGAPKSAAGVQRAPAREPGPAVAAPEAVHVGLRSPATPLDPHARRFMETRLGADFSQVRVHADAAAAHACGAVGARAYTVGRDLVFGTGQYRPHDAAGLRLIAHELTHVLQQRGGALRVHRALLYPDAAVTERNDNPIARYLANDDSLALTTLTINGSVNADADRIIRAFLPTAIEQKSAPQVQAPAPGVGTGSGLGSGSGSGSGSGGGSGAAQPSMACGYKDFDVKVSANMRLPRAPKDGRWGPEAVERKTIRRALPGECASKDRISVVMKGDPDSESIHAWLVANEDDHLKDIRAAARRFLEPLHRDILALRGSGADATACEADLKRRLDQLSVAGIDDFRTAVRDDIAGRDVPGGHKFDVAVKTRNQCDNLELMLKKSRPAPRRRPP